MKYDRIIFNIVLILCLQDIVGIDKFCIYLVAGFASSFIFYVFNFFQKKSKKLEDNYK